MAYMAYMTYTSRYIYKYMYMVNMWVSGCLGDGEEKEKKKWLQMVREKRIKSKDII